MKLLFIMFFATVVQRDDSLNAVIHKIKDVEEIKLTPEQQRKYAEIKKQHDVKLQAFEEAKDAVLTEEQRKKKAQFKPATDRKQSIQRQFEAFLGFNREQRNKVREIDKECGNFMNAVHKEVVEILTPKQIEEPKKLREAKRAKREKRKKVTRP